MTHKPELLHVIEQNERDKDARCVRLVDSNGVFALVIDEKYGERFAALWNMAERLGLSTEEIENNAFEKIVISLIDLINHDKAMIESGVFHHFIEVEAGERTIRETLGENYVEMIRSDSK